MLVYGINADRAFDVLTWRSQQTNTKLRTLAQNIVASVDGKVPFDDEQADVRPSAAHRAPGFGRVRGGGVTAGDRARLTDRRFGARMVW